MLHAAASDVLDPYRQRFLLRLPLDVAMLPVMRSRVRSFLGQDGLDGDLIDDVVLCIQEACKNAIRYSHSSRGIVVKLALSRAWVRVVVRDYGVGMRNGSLELTPTPLAESGRGLHIIRKIMDDVEVHIGQGTELRMRKAVPLVGRGGADTDLALSA